MKKRVAIGTAQFGSDYGINNKTGRLSDEEINQVLNICSVNDISFLDTAYVYGDSEKRIGKYCEENKRYFSIITKLPDCNINEFDKIFNDSLLRLKTDNVYGYLIHNINSFRKNPEIFNKLRKKKEAGKIKKIGFSLYNADELQMLFDIDFNFDLIQFPYNIFDRRFEPYFDTLKEKNVEIHTRSVYLQGLFFINPEELNIYFKTNSIYYVNYQIDWGSEFRLCVFPLL